MQNINDYYDYDNYKNLFSICKRIKNSQFDWNYINIKSVKNGSKIYQVYHYNVNNMFFCTYHKCNFASYNKKKVAKHIQHHSTYANWG